MRILLTGGAGYIGSHTLRQLAHRGFEPLVFDNLSTGHAFLAGSARLIVGDIRDRDALLKAMQGVEAVVHFAARAYVGESVHKPREYFDTNICGGFNVLDAARDSGVRFFVFSSSCAVYGIPPGDLITEDTARQPVNPYGASKLFLENALDAYARAYGLRFVSLRYFNAAGAEEGGEIGELHDPEPHLIPSALQAAQGLRPELSVFGSDYPTPDGSCIRDYVHVNDLAEAHVLALEYLVGGGQSIALNLGTGHGHSVYEVIAEIERVTGRPVPRRVCPRRAGDPPVLVADPSRAESLLRWKARRDLPGIISTAWAWMQSRRMAQRMS